ncbi:hypothetical protein BU586_03520 [Staphylococcus agnetis]|uniref:Uncharacterized protein n=1 Tax=Staphylococcus agnetis TaxID=985762 RepID=A0ABD7TUG6_9STAP|nr:hypothetical protein [Staphylococcus agnetis]ALN77038.1 hypothetical protein EP23_06625 [Staphylococcus agnetis]MCO4337946.1 hypothetical protein [Staphylococcus agnetis]MCO4344869.1 hypothetical protein [Staphylococcus agnetis]MCO4354523.1 hypothetical protein [Staphylococcus agnetis]MCO4357022.1 hypothetical protein [Staphylococcus agnetis]
MFSKYTSIMMGLTVLLLFQIYFAFYYLFGEGAMQSSPILGVISLIFAVVVIAIMLAVRHYFKNHN